MSLTRTPTKPIARLIPSPELSQAKTVAPSGSGSRRNLGESAVFRETLAQPETTLPKPQLNISYTIPAATPTPAVPPMASIKTKNAAPPKASIKKASTATVTEVCPGSPEMPKTYSSRREEARACITSAKLHLNGSRNLKTDIKAGAFKALDRLYQLFKEVVAETEKGEKRQDSVGVTPLSPPAPSEISTRAAADQQAILEKLEEHGRLLRENKEKMVGLQAMLEKQVTTIEKSSYASVTAGGPRKPAPTQKTLHSIVVTSKDETDTGDQVLSHVREAVDAKNGWVKVERVRKAKDQKVIIGCDSIEERNKLKERLSKPGTKLNIKELKNQDPQIMLRDVTADVSDEEIVKALSKQNKEIFEGLKSEDVRMAVRFRRKAKNPLVNHVAMKVSPALWVRMTNAGAVQVDLQRVHVFDHSPLIQCSQCLGYGHGKQHCKEKDVKCSHCGGAHMQSKCTVLLANAPPTCCNCSGAKMDKADHSAFSSDCPVRQKWDALARAKTAYC